MAKWAKNENLQEINLRHRDIKECSQDVIFSVIVSQLRDADVWGKE